MKQTKIDTLSKAQTRKMTPYSQEKQELKIAWMGQLFEQVNVFCLTG